MFHPWKKDEQPPVFSTFSGDATSHGKRMEDERWPESGLTSTEELIRRIPVLGWALTDLPEDAQAFARTSRR
jgi:hypothetical protein